MFKLEFSTDNAAFGDDHYEDRKSEIVRILRNVALKIEQDGLGLAAKVRDFNGNTIGKWETD